MIVATKVRFLAAIVFGSAAVATFGQEKAPALEEINRQADLDQAIAELDLQLFDANNHCDLKRLAKPLADDVEFSTTRVA